MGQYANEKATTPKGNLKWAFVTGEGRKDKFSVVVKVHKDEPEAIEAMKHIDEFWTANKPKGAKPRPKTKAYKMEEDEDTGAETGYVYFSASTPTTYGKSGDKKTVKIFTAKAPVREVSLNGKQIGEESIGRAMGVLAIYEYEGSFGTTMYLDAISLSKFVEYVGGVDASDVVTDDDADDIDLGETVVGTEAVQEEETSSEDTPRV